MTFFRTLKPLQLNAYDHTVKLMFLRNNFNYAMANKETQLGSYHFVVFLITHTALDGVNHLNVLLVVIHNTLF